MWAVWCCCKSRKAIAAASTGKFANTSKAGMHLAPLFSRRLAFMPLDLANPIWLDGAGVNLDDHIDT